MLRDHRPADCTEAVCRASWGAALPPPARGADGGFAGPSEMSFQEPLRLALAE